MIALTYERVFLAVNVSLLSQAALASVLAW